MERAGYIRREQGRDAKGKMADMVYTIYEQPVLAKPVLENPVLENPTSDNPTSDNPASGNRVNPKFCVNSNSGANRAKFICGGSRLVRLPPY